jgi:hypothetical protein
MAVSKKRFILGLSAILLGILTACGIAFFSISQRASAPRQVASTDTKQPTQTTSTPTATPKSYAGVQTSVADAFHIKVPGGWKASVSTSPSFTAIMFARPNQLQTLVYDATSQPAVDYDGIPSWGGLTEHFFVLAPTSANQFDPSAHQEISSEPFTFDDGTAGQKYYVVKHADEAKKWGGLLKDTEWQGRTYIYERDGERVEAHIAIYPSSTIDIPFYESVVRTITTN